MKTNTTKIQLWWLIVRWEYALVPLRRFLLSEFQFTGVYAHKLSQEKEKGKKIGKIHNFKGSILAWADEQQPLVNPATSQPTNRVTLSIFSNVIQLIS
jgi:hypothetical protein